MPLDCFQGSKQADFLPIFSTCGLKDVKSCCGECYVYRLLGRERLYPSCCRTSNRAALCATDKTSFCDCSAEFYQSAAGTQQFWSTVCELCPADRSTAQQPGREGRVEGGSGTVDYTLSLVFLPWGKTDKTKFPAPREWCASLRGGFHFKSAFLCFPQS